MTNLDLPFGCIEIELAEAIEIIMGAKRWEKQATDIQKWEKQTADIQTFSQSREATDNQIIED